MKAFNLLCVFLSVTLLFCGCDITYKNKNIISDPISNLNEEDSSENESIIEDMNGSDKNSDTEEKQTELSVEDYISKLENENVLASAMFLSPANPDCFAPLVYNGGDFVFYYQIGSSTDKEHCIGFTLNGVYQDIKIEYRGETTEYATMHKVKLSAGQSKVLKIMLRPNIGSKGETLQFCNATICSTETKIILDDFIYNLEDHDLNNTLVSDFIMNSDSTNTASINSSYKNVSIESYSENLKKHFTANNETGEICQMVIYNDLNKILFEDNDIYRTLLFSPIIETKYSTSVPMTIALSGKPGTTQRISLYINDSIVPAFDGKYYADIKMEYNKQTTVTLNIDTSELDTWNNIYCIASTHNADAMDSYVLSQSDVYVLKVA